MLGSVAPAGGARDSVADGAREGALFERDGARIVPTDLARGPWRPDALHGGAVAAVLASAIDVPGRTPARVTFDLLAPVPCAPLRILATAPEGGERVARQTITLLRGDEVVASAQCLAIRRVELDLPEPPADVPNPFDGTPTPDISKAKPIIAEAIGWECFDSGAISVRRLRAPLPEYATGVYVNLLVSVVAGEPTPSIARAAAAADYASNHTSTRLPFETWSYMNADLTLHLSRIPADSWIGLVSTGVTAPNGSGLSVAQLFDAEGRLGQSAQALVVESRTRAG